MTDPTGQSAELNRLADWLQAELDKYDFSREQVVALPAGIHRLPTAVRFAWKLKAIGQFALFPRLATRPLATTNTPADNALGSPP